MSTDYEPWRILLLSTTVKGGTNPHEVRHAVKEIVKMKRTLTMDLTGVFHGKTILSSIDHLVRQSKKISYFSIDEEQRLRKTIALRDEKLKAKRASANQWRQERGYECLLDLNSATFADHMTPMILISMNTGLRRGELFSLQWENIDFNRAMITIEGGYAKSGKTRHIPLNTEALNTLKSWRAQSFENPLVFPGKNGAPFDSIKKAWANILKEATIKHFRWHDLRHHFTSKLVMATVDLNTVRELLGHFDIAMTLRYAHLAPEHKAEAVERLVKVKI